MSKGRICYGQQILRSAKVSGQVNIAPRYNTANLRANSLHHIYNSRKTTILLFSSSNPDLLSSDPRPERFPILALTSYSSTPSKNHLLSGEKLTTGNLIARYWITYRWRHFGRALAYFKGSMWVFLVIKYYGCQSGEGASRLSCIRGPRGCDVARMIKALKSINYCWLFGRKHRKSPYGSQNLPTTENYVPFYRSPSIDTWTKRLFWARKL